jgi:hypothetical protein
MGLMVVVTRVELIKMTKEGNWLSGHLAVVVVVRAEKNYSL